MRDEVLVRRRAKRSTGGEKVDGFKQAGLACTIDAMNAVEPRVERNFLGYQVAQTGNL